MARTRIKICGITRVEDALAAADLGVDAIGVVRDPQSPRSVSTSQAAEIVQVVPPFVSVVFLYVNASADRISSECQELGVQWIQLHGNEPPEFLRDLPPAPRVIKAVRVHRDSIDEDLSPWRGRSRDGPAGIVLETAGVSGGSGIENDWDSIRRAQQGGVFADLPPLILAGGLTPENVAGVVRDLRPWGVDVSSGVEAETKGVKSRELMRAFIEAVRTADAHYL